MAANTSALREALRRLYDTGEYSDLTIECGSEIFRVHKALMCTFSTWFATTCKEGRWKEGNEGYIYLESTQAEHEEDPSVDDPAAIKAMISFIYLDTYDAVIEDEKFGSRPDLVLHTKTYALGDKYDIPPLKDIALHRFLGDVEDAWNNDDFPEAARITFTTTPDSDLGLRNVVTEVLLQHSTELACKPEIEAVVKDLNGLAYNLWKLTNARRTGPTCIACRNVFVRACTRCGRSSKRHTAFVTCDCEPSEYCANHRSGDAGFMF
ncbi:hypothetical protein K431DRAFT_258318 [Polychaeton citri CBS 116435]|uniref:BTB domain-containing protein n=1 Tax=Polychaeton citri CBS 116435 TaxID=1314669 RepID=A0A9P4PYB2_9PEZI|nr:hypothetical protein K431DRAFT_258318 [Polychaeton citri CBS 116435]